MTTYCRQGNLNLLLDNITDAEFLEDFDEAMEALQAIEQEDHRGMFAGTDLAAWTSPNRDFKATPTVISESTLDNISELLCKKYDMSSDTWRNQLARDAFILKGVVAMGRMVFSANIRENSVIFGHEERQVAGTIERIISHSHPHPGLGSTETVIFIQVLVLEPIDEVDDLYRKLGCGWLCLPSSTKRQLVPLEAILSPFTRTILHIQGRSVLHVYPETKVSTRETFETEL